MMCHHLGNPEAYTHIRKSVARVTRAHKESLTPDLGGRGTTASLTDAIIGELERRLAA
jgi:isocitrate/isopropylmalate dehydrogenase